MNYQDWPSTYDGDLCYKIAPRRYGSLWFPYAEMFVAKFPQLAVRVFWVCIKVKEMLVKYRELGHYNVL